MKDKKCSGCDEEKIVKGNKSGLCVKCRQKKYYKDNKGKILIRQKEWILNNKKKIKEYYSQPSVRKKQLERQKRSDVKAKRNIQKKDYRSKPKVKKREKEYNEKWCKDNPNYHKDYLRSYVKTPKFKKYIQNRMKNDVHFRISCLIRRRLREAITKYTKEGKIMSSNKYGINFKKIIKHLKPFPADTSKYHIDHIKPLASFNFVNEDGTQNLEEIQKAFTPENHQWLLIKDNLMKSNKVIEQSRLF